MTLSTIDFLHAACTNKLGAMAANGSVTVQPTTPQQVPALQRLVASPDFQAIITLCASRNEQTAVIALHPTFHDALASVDQETVGAPDASRIPSFSAQVGSATLQWPLQKHSPGDFPGASSLSDRVGYGWLQLKPQKPVSAAVASKATVAQLQPSIGWQSTAISNQASLLLVTNAKELQAICAGQRPFNTAGMVAGASAGAAIGLGLALVGQALRAVVPTTGPAFDFGCMLIGAGVGGGVGGKLWAFEFDVEKKTFGLTPTK
jgi:hypothetical protein